MTRRLRVFLTHTEADLPLASQPASLEALRACADVVLNRSGHVLAGRDLAAAAAGCEAIIAHRATPGTAETFEAAPALVASRARHRRSVWRGGCSRRT